MILTENVKIAEYNGDAVFLMDSEGKPMAWYAG